MDSLHIRWVCMASLSARETPTKQRWLMQSRLQNFTLKHLVKKPFPSIRRFSMRFLWKQESTPNGEVSGGRSQAARHQRVGVIGFRGYSRSRTQRAQTK